MIRSAADKQQDSGESRLSPAKRPLLTRSDLRLALTAGLSGGLIITLGLPNPIYGPVSVGATLKSTVGASRGMGVQLMLAIVLGGAIIAILYPTLGKAMPVPLGAALAMACARLFSGVWGIHSYKVAMAVAAVGWTIHGSELNTWIPYRLLVTMISVLLAWLAAETFWPSRALHERLKLSRRLYVGIAHALRELAEHLERGENITVRDRLIRRDELLAILLQTQSLRNEAEQEISSNEQRETLGSLWDLQRGLLYSFIATFRTLLRLQTMPAGFASLTLLLMAEVEGLRALAKRLDFWSQSWPDGSCMRDGSDEQNGLIEALKKLEDAEIAVFADGMASQAMIKIGGGRRAVACHQLLQSAIDFELAWFDTLADTGGSLAFAGLQNVPAPTQSN